MIMKPIRLFALFCLLTSSLHAQWLWDKNKMSQIKQQLHTLTYAPAYDVLLKQANKYLSTPTYSVTKKKGMAPSGDKHDYVSLSRYWWPNPNTPDKLPYIYKDGQSNPELERYDRNTLGDMCAAVNTLSLAYYYSGAEKYAEKAVQFLRVWFLNESTKMNPNLEYSQFIPGKDNSKGRPEGLIDSYSFVSMLNSIHFLKNSKFYTSKDEQGLKNWFAQFATWMQQSTQGQKEKSAKNNHSTAYDAQLITYFLFSDNEKAARAIINEFPSQRMFVQIEPDGKQPNELWRTLAYHYSQYNLSHMLDVCATAQKLGINLLDQQSADGRSIYKAFDYLISFLGKDVSSWPYKQISGWESKQQDVCKELLKILDLNPTKQNYLEVYNKYAQQDLTDRWRLYYGAPDPIKTLFNFATSQMEYALKRIEDVYQPSSNTKAIFPRSVDEKERLVLVPSRDWCSGFFPGSLWMLYRYTHEDKWKKVADKYTRLLEDEKNDEHSHDVGFKINCSYGNGYLLTGNTAYKNIIIEAAATLSKRYSPQVGAIRSWDFNREVWKYPVIIDNMMNLELLFEAARLSGNSEYYKIADAHATTTLKNHFRADYSSYHVVDYDPQSGKVRKKNTHQGYADHSAWARGQAWALYGYTMCYRYTTNTLYLQQAQQIVNFIFQHPNLPADLIPYWDYNDPSIPKAPKDASAACITASALYELATYNKKDSVQYIQKADAIVSSLLRHYRSKENTNEGFLLLHSTGHYPKKSEIDVPISYADYYFLEALTRRNAINSAF